MLSASKILIKRSSVPGAVPSLTSLDTGELAINIADKKIFFKDTDNKLATFEESPFTFLSNLSSIIIKNGNNNVTEVYSNVFGGYNNDITGAGSTVINGENNDISGDFAVIVNGLNNTIDIGGDYGAILGGKNNTLNDQESFILGSNITSHLSGFTYVNNLSSLGKIYGDGSNLTGIVAGDTEATTLVRTNSAQWNVAYSSTGADLAVRALTANWESTYTIVTQTSSNWNSTYTNVQFNSGNWDTTHTTVQSNSANWETAYAYVSANSVNLTATNIFVTNDLTVSDTVSAKFYQGTILDWMTLVRGYKTTPTLNISLPAGDVYNYTFSTAGSDVTYYRYISNDGSEDSFYGNFANPTLSNLIATKKIIL